MILFNIGTQEIENISEAGGIPLSPNQKGIMLVQEVFDKGGDWMDRWKYDHGFYRRMIQDSFRQRFYLVPIALFWAYCYYIAVRLGGWASFNYKK